MTELTRLPAVNRELTDTSDVALFAQMTDDDERQIVLTGLTFEPIRLDPDTALRIGRSLQKLSGKAAPEKPRQEPSDITRHIAKTARAILDAAPTVQWDPAGRAPTYVVLRFLASSWLSQGWNWIPSQQALGRAMRVLGLDAVKSHGERFYVGLTVASEEGYLPPEPATDGGQTGADSHHA